MVLLDAHDFFLQACGAKLIEMNFGKWKKWLKITDTFLSFGLFSKWVQNNAQTWFSENLKKNEDETQTQKDKLKKSPIEGNQILFGMRLLDLSDQSRKFLKRSNNKIKRIKRKLALIWRTQRKISSISRPFLRNVNQNTHCKTKRIVNFSK